MLRSIRRGLHRHDAPVDLSLGAEADPVAGKMRILLEGRPTNISEEDQQELMRALADENTRLVYSPGGDSSAARAQGGPIVRFDCTWVTWDEVAASRKALPSFRMTAETDLPSGSFALDDHEGTGRAER